MNAIRMHQTGGVDVLRVEQVDAPTPGPGEVLIRVAVAGVNYTDVMARQASTSPATRRRRYRRYSAPRSRASSPPPGPAAPPSSSAGA